MTNPNPEVAAVAERLSPAMKEAMATLPLPRDANPVRMIAARPYGSLWRKSAKHWTAMRALEEKGLVERTVSRGETLWRLTRPIGLAVRSYLLSQEAGEGSGG